MTSENDDRREYEEYDDRRVSRLRNAAANRPESAYLLDVETTSFAFRSRYSFRRLFLKS